MKYRVADKIGNQEHVLLVTNDLQDAVNMSVRHRCPIYLVETGEIVVTSLRANRW